LSILRASAKAAAGVGAGPRGGPFILAEPNDVVR